MQYKVIVVPRRYPPEMAAFMAQQRTRVLLAAFYGLLGLLMLAGATWDIFK